MEEAKVGKILLMLIIENVHHSLRASVTRRILWVPLTLQNKTLGVHWGILGLFFFTRSPPHSGHENVGCISLWQSMPTLEDRVGECPASPFSTGAYSWWVKVWTSGQLQEDVIQWLQNLAWWILRSFLVWIFWVFELKMVTRDLPNQLKVWISCANSQRN